MNKSCSIKEMARQLLILFIALGACHADETKPILVILEQNPWLMVIGSDSPTLALYEDGTLISLQEKPTQEGPLQIRKVTDAKKKVAELLAFEPAKLESIYALSSATDQVTTVIWTPAKEIRIYENWRKARYNENDPDPTLREMAVGERKMRESLPVAIRETLIRIDKERSIKGIPWLPAKIDVMFWPYDYAPDPSIVWPEGWPSLSANDTKFRGEGSYSVYLPSKHLPELEKFLATQSAKGAIMIEGKKMTAGHRFPFPKETTWMK